MDLGHILYVAVMLPKFYKIISLEKKKILYEIEASNTASLHRTFYSLEVTARDFYGVAYTLADSRGWGCDKYYRVIGSLMYLMSCTRLDIAYSVSKLSSYTSNSGAKP